MVYNLKASKVLFQNLNLWISDWILDAKLICCHVSESSEEKILFLPHQKIVGWIFIFKWRKFVPNFLGVIETAWGKCKESWNISLYFSHPWPNFHQRLEAARPQPPTTVHPKSKVYSSTVYSVTRLSMCPYPCLSLVWVDALTKIFQCSDVFLGFGSDIVLIAGSASHISRWSLLLSASCWHLHFINITTCLSF